MRIQRVAPLELIGEDGESLRVEWDNRGEPYREGVSLTFEDGKAHLMVFLDTEETKQLRDKLNELLPPGQS